MSNINLNKESELEETLENANSNYHQTSEG